MEYLAFRNLVGVSHTEDEVKAIAEEVRPQQQPAPPATRGQRWLM